MSSLLNKLEKQVIQPALASIKSSALGYVMEVNDLNKTANVIIMEKDGTKRRKNNLSFESAIGIQNQNLKPGDTVEIGYRNNEASHSYIIRVHQSAPAKPFVVNGQNLPNFTNLY